MMRRSPQQLANLRRSASFSASKSASTDKFTPQDAADLQRNMLGSVVLASTEGYDVSRQDFIRTHQSFPQLIAYCEVPRDVQTCLKFASEHGLHPVCRSGGHSTAGFSVNDEMVIDVSRISYVVVDEAKRTAKVGAGTNFEKLNAILTQYKLHVPGGGCPSVAVGGYMQGGGYGFTSLMFGMNCDNVIETVVALGSGEIVIANEQTNKDLLWAVRGGTGNNFGVLLEITYGLHELDELQGFGLSWPLDTQNDLERATEVLVTWQAAFTGAKAADELGHEAFILDVQRPGEVSKPELLIRGVYRGSAAACEVALRPLLGLCSDLSRQRDIWKRGTYEYLNEYLMTYPTDLPDVPMNIRALIESRIVERQLGCPGWRRLLDYFSCAENGAMMIGLEPYGGVINRRAPRDTAFVHRRATMDVFVWTFWMQEEERRRAERHIRDFREILAPLYNGQSYQNYPNRGTPRGAYPQLYWGVNYERLRRVKAKYDPKNLFQFPQMIHPPEAGRYERPKP
jgi:FAD/FMN-containing dehydrogenase